MVLCVYSVGLLVNQGPLFWVYSCMYVLCFAIMLVICKYCDLLAVFGGPSVGFDWPV